MSKKVEEKFILSSAVYQKSRKTRQNIRRQKKWRKSSFFRVLFIKSREKLVKTFGVKKVEFILSRMPRIEEWEDLDKIEDVVAEGGLSYRTLRSAKNVVATLNKFLVSEYNEDLDAMIKSRDEKYVEERLINYFIRFRKNDGTKPKLTYLSFHKSFITTHVSKATENRWNLHDTVQFAKLNEFFKG